MPSALVKSGKIICASSGDADVTADRRGVMFDSPKQGPGWHLLTRAAGGNSLFTVAVSGQGRSWSKQFRCAFADVEQVQMDQPELAAPANPRRSARGPAKVY